MGERKVLLENYDLFSRMSTSTHRQWLDITNPTKFATLHIVQLLYSQRSIASCFFFFFHVGCRRI